jgi:acyl-CoA reductase-like NAD-dependent aldehyde dehydrogenase
VLELGGNDPLIILNDLCEDDLVKAAHLAVAGATKNAGQRCTAVKRVLVQEKVADRFVPSGLEELISSSRGRVTGRASRIDRRTDQTSP